VDFSNSLRFVEFFATTTVSAICNTCTLLAFIQLFFPQQLLLKAIMLYNKMRNDHDISPGKDWIYSLAMNCQGTCFTWRRSLSFFSMEEHQEHCQLNE
jgi:hypothetical protein